MRPGFSLRRSTVLLAFALLTLSLSARADDTYDVVVRGGRIVDGTGAPWYIGDIGIRDGKIVRIGRLADAAAGRVIDATGLVVAPGFIDMMGQTATPMLEDPATAMNLLTQGITTINAGEGASAAPLDDEGERRYGWKSFAGYFQLLDLKGLPVNVAQTVGHTQVRRQILGEVDRRPTDDELKQMQELVRQAMRDGAIGVSTALIYPPAVYAQTEEITALASAAGEFGGRYYTHMRNEGDRLLEAIDEALEIGAKAKTPVHIFHLKAAGRQNWGKMQLAIARIKAARAAGHQVTADIYPYVNNGLGMAAFIHPRHFGEGREKLIRQLDDLKLRAEIRKEMETTDGWENWYRHVGYDWNRVVIGQPNDPRYSEFIGKTVAEIAKASDEEPWDTFFNLVRSGAFALPQSMTDANKILAMQQDFVSFCTDVGPAGGSRIASHPRAFGSFPRLLSRYVRDLGAITLERAIAQASATAANDLLAYDRGRIAVGQAADIIAFDYEALADKATFANPHELATGMTFVLVNGELVLDDGKFTGKRPGRVLRGPGWNPDQDPHSIKTGKSADELTRLDELMQSMIEKHRLPGAALAVTHKGRLVHARGYGYADVEAREPATPQSLYRIASISKPVTAVAILQLVDQGKLNLDTPVFKILDGYEPYLEGDAKFDERQNDITIQHLLQHRGGWDRGKSFDAMFQPIRFAEALGAKPPAGPTEITRMMLGLPLDFDPGTQYAYSNYGYCLLGRVIEKLTDQPYDAYVKEHVLAPIGVTSMSIGKTHLEGRQKNEVRYYSQFVGESVFAKDLRLRVPSPYGAWHLEAMDSHGAWIASAVDLARFATAFDDPEKCYLLKPQSVRAFLTHPSGKAEDQSKPGSYYGLGWSVSVSEAGQPTASHGGSLPGTNTALIRRPDGINIAVLFNTRATPHTGSITSDAVPQLEQAVKSVASWPAHDLFSEFK
ncbi:MAG: serine hydrolase [Planctomycetota bacterium]|nr:serine hydrolase [Planctomycetota bacterium]MDA1249554.1 serine hydrolase [Planctomycetota bacterium]